MDLGKRKRSSSCDKAEEMRKRLKVILSTYKDKENFADLTLYCGAERWYLHRAIVCPQSDFFSTACNGTFMESTSQVISLYGDDPKIVKLMLDYFYTLEYPDCEIDDLAGLSSKPKLSVNALLYGLAEKYGVKELKEAVISRTAELMGGKDGPIFWEDFGHAVQVVWSSTPASDKGLRKSYI